MSDKKWGESFLKTGLPLEHLTVMAFNSLGWECDLHYEYERENRESETVWFEIDMVAYSPRRNRDRLRFLVECKYHDTSRFWFFLPCATSSHTAHYRILDTDDKIETNSRVFTCVPYQILANPRSPSVLKLAPKSLWGVVVGSDGTKQDNAVHTATQQLAHAFVKYVLDNFYGIARTQPAALIPIVVTNADIFRLRPEVCDLDRIRQANSPGNSR
jgi:hypothetical protein